MEPIIDIIDRDLLKQELTRERFIRFTNAGKNEIYIFKGHEAQALMDEVGRLREVSFRKAGGGSGKSKDVDEFDLGKYAYDQLIVWNPTDEEIIGGYRYILVRDAMDENGEYHLSTSEIVEYSEKLKKEYFSRSHKIITPPLSPDASVLPSGLIAKSLTPAE